MRYLFPSNLFGKPMINSITGFHESFDVGFGKCSFTESTFNLATSYFGLRIIFTEGGN